MNTAFLWLAVQNVKEKINGKTDAKWNCARNEGRERMQGKTTRVKAAAALCGLRDKNNTKKSYLASHRVKDKKH